MIELIAVHIPKTGGVSFERALQSVYGKDRVLRLEIPIWAEKQEQRSNLPDLPEAIPTEIQAIIGHFRYPHLREKYQLDRKIPVITWLRDPVERVLSDFFFQQKLLRDIVREKERDLHLLDTIQRTLLEFARDKSMRNRMARFLEGQDIADLFFIGILERYAEDLKDLAELFDWSTYASFHHNRTPRESILQALRESDALPPKNESVGKVEGAILDEIRELNYEDLALYNQALEIRAVRRREMGYEDDGASSQADLTARQVDTISVYHENKDPVLRKKILIEASKISQTHMDGSKRYARGLLKGLLSITDEWIEDFQIHVSVNGWITDLHALPYISSFDSFALQPVISDMAWFRRVLTIGKTWLRHTFTMKIFLGWHYFLRLIYSRPASKFLLSIKKLFPRSWNFFKSFKDARVANRIAKGDGGPAYDLVHLTIPQNYSIMHDGKYVMTVLDFTHFYFPNFHIDENLKITKQGLEFALNRNADFIAISESTRKDLLREYKVSPGQVNTIHLGCDKERFRPTPDPTTLLRVRRKHRLGGTPYFLSVGTLEPRKNLTNTLRAFLVLLKDNPELDVNFVVVGKKGWKYEEIFQGEFVSDRIIFLQTVSDNDLAPLYSGSIALCYASFYEGFGLPPLEAMSCATPVIFGNNSSLPEIVGDGGLPVEPGNVQDIKEKMLLIASDKGLRERLAWNAYKRARRFSWEKTARETIRVYQQILTA